MSVYNGASSLERTLDSIAAQTEGGYELIVIDDGSDDETPAILRRRAAADPRIRVITQPNAGLTRALIRGCGEARGEFIARHDCGDVSLPERFARQLAVMTSDVVLSSCGVRVVGPEGEPLYEVRENGESVRRSLLHAGVNTLRGLPHHGSAMFRRDACAAAGGYREEFRFAQDLDLWLRLAPRGRIAILDEVLYEAQFALGSISASRRAEQLALAEIAIALRDGGPASLLDDARAIGAGRRRAASDAAGLYFIASCLRRNRDNRFRRYARAALRRDPLHLRAWLLLLRGAK